MLLPAAARKEELERLFAEHLYAEDMFFYTGYPHCNSIPNVTPKADYYDWVILDGDKVVAFFSYYVDAFSNNVSRFGFYSFDRGNPIIGMAVYKKMKELLKKHHRVEWRMIGGNPVQKHYDNLCARFNGRKVIFRDVVKDSNGEYHDEHVYEIINNEA